MIMSSVSFLDCRFEEVELVKAAKLLKGGVCINVTSIISLYMICNPDTLAIYQLFEVVIASGIG